MKTCKFCGKEFDENLTFCPFCGKENAERKLTYMEKKKAREKDTEIILSKASIQDEDIKKANEGQLSWLYSEKVGTIRNSKTKSLILIILSIIAMIGCVVWAQITLKNDIQNNLKLLIVVVAYFVVAVAGAICISEIHVFRAYLNLEKQPLVVSKVTFNKGPMFVYKDCLYEMETSEKCHLCDGELHVEEKEGQIVFVCSKNRAHLYTINMEEYFAQFKEKIEQN